MKTPFDTDGMLYRLLEGRTSIGGGVYVGDDRPENSTEEDIVINTIDLPVQYLPQTGTSNVNIYCRDIEVTVGGATQLKADRARLRTLSDEVLEIIRGANMTGLKAITGDMSVMTEPETKQHFVNIRIDWNIQID